MIVVDCEQGDAVWNAARCGVVTASAASKLLTPKLSLSSQSTGYRNELLAEWALGYAVELPSLYWVERGQEREPEARAYYEFQRDVEVETVGFVYRDETKLSGCSPDWLCGENGMAEVKCPSAHVHVGYLLGGGVKATYVPQVQFQLWVTGRKWCDFVSYHENFPTLIVRVEADDLWNVALNSQVPKFTDQMLECRRKLRDLGVSPVKLDLDEIRKDLNLLRDASSGAAPGHGGWALAGDKPF